ncbi:STM4014 family protein [Nannocystaceae bacterium ST9]
MTRFLILGNPANRRVGGFVEALRERGQPEPIVIAHRELLREPERLLALPDEPLLVRMDSTGEDPEVESLLLEQGWPDAREAACTSISPRALSERGGVRFGEILAPRQHQLGFVRYLDRLAAAFAQRPSWRILQSPTSVAELFDKRVTSRRYAALGIPIPEPLDDVSTPDRLRELMLARRWPAVFVKLACGSSASCVALYQCHRERERLLTTTHVRPDGRFNSLRLQELHERAPIDALLEFLIAEGSQIERAIGKARIGSRVFDLRVLVIAGEPVFVVPRASPHPITNLHLGGIRADLAAVRDRVPPDAWRRAMASAREVFAAHQCLHVGVDLLFESDLHGHRVIEANAFGDLLPGLERGGLSVYAWEIAAALGHELPALD